jgi:glycosyltransferase involved in cell wall biosynthesis
MKVLFASRYVDPVDPRANRNIVRQARMLREGHGVDVCILTWPGGGDMWAGPVPSQRPTIEPLAVEREGLPYLVIDAPVAWEESAGGNVIGEDAWQEAVVYGVELLARLRPDILHLHHRFGFWWLLESAQRLGIPTVYSNYDWGIACLRTLLVTAAGELCDGVVEPGKCAVCIRSGRGRIGRLNEAIADNAAGRRLLAWAGSAPGTGTFLRRRGGVTLPVGERVALHQSRLERVMRALGHCVTPSSFGGEFFARLGVAPERITVLPWGQEPAPAGERPNDVTRPFTLTFIGRVAPDKGVHMIFEACERLQHLPPLLLRIAGANDSEYCRDLRSRFPGTVGQHHVEWFGWSPIDQLLRSTDVLLAPSVWMDNTPLTVLEALAYHVPVVGTDIPTISDLVRGRGVGYLAQFGSSAALAKAITRAVHDKDLIRARSAVFPALPTPHEYAARLVDIYCTQSRPAPSCTKSPG